MAFGQIQWMGATVRHFSSSVGWGGGQASRLQVNLVEDPLAGDDFQTPSVGTPALFQFGSFRFCGLVQSVEETNSTEGASLFSVTLTDPKEILEGTQVILANYNGSVGGVRNVLNVYGYWENLGGFGASFSNDAGIPFFRVRDGILALVNQPAMTAYGGPMMYRGCLYGLDLSDLPNPPAYYRITNGISIGLLELISQIADDSGSDFFVDLMGQTIKVRTVSRRTAPPLGTITALVESTTYAGQVMSSSIGLEARNEQTSAFLVGDNYTTMHETFSLTPFWGYDVNNSIIIGDPGYYLWRSVPIGGWTNKVISASGSLGLKADAAAPVPVPTTIPVLARTPPSPKLSKVMPEVSTSFDMHLYWKYEQVGIDTYEVMNLNSAPIYDILGTYVYNCSTLELRFALAGMDSWLLFMQMLRNEVSSAVGLTSTWAGMAGLALPFKGDVVNDKRADVLNRAAVALSQNSRAKQVRFYEFVLGYAREYYGKKFLVQLPFQLLKQDQETARWFASYDISDGAITDTGIAPLSLPLAFEDFFKLPDGRFKALTKFTNTIGVDQSQVSPQGTLALGTDLWVECQVLPQRVSLNVAPSPLCIITLQGAVYETAKDDRGDMGIVKALFQMNPEAAALVFSKPSAGNVTVRCAPAARYPTYAAIPLKSNILTYGPWYAQGAAGKVRVEQDASLNPWTYGSVEVMNLAGLARVSQAITTGQVYETGALELPGMPNASLGDVLEANGPNVTSVDVRYGADGVTTSYRFHTFTPRFGGYFNRGAVERLRRISQAGQELKRYIRGVSRDRWVTSNLTSNPTRAARKFFLDEAPKAVKRESPHDVFMCESVFDTNWSGVRVLSSLMTSEEAIDMLYATGELYRHTAIMSMGGLVHPFSTKPSGEAFVPGYVAPAWSGGITVGDIDPWKGPNDIELYTWGDDYENISNIRSTGVYTNARVVGLRGPVVVTGWGYDTDGNPVPADSGAPPDDPDWLHEHLKRSDKWKTGPIDDIWDERRGVWTSHDFVKGYAPGVLDDADRHLVCVPEIIGSGGKRLEEGGPFTGTASGQWNLYVESFDGELLDGPVVCLFNAWENVWYGFRPGVLPSGEPYTVYHTTGSGEQVWSSIPNIQAIRLGGEEAGNGYLTYGFEGFDKYHHVYPFPEPDVDQLTWQLPTNVPWSGTYYLSTSNPSPYPTGTFPETHTLELEWKLDLASSSGVNGSVTYVSAITCSGCTLIVTTRTMTFVRGILVRDA